MTRAKADIALAPRTRAYPDAEGCAAEFGCSPNTWARWVQDGDAPPAIPGLSPPRWRWKDVDAWFSDPRSREDILLRYAIAERPAAGEGPPGVAGAPLQDHASDPYLDAVRRTAGAPKKGRRREPAV